MKGRESVPLASILHIGEREIHHCLYVNHSVSEAEIVVGAQLEAGG